MLMVDKDAPVHVVLKSTGAIAPAGLFSACLRALPGATFQVWRGLREPDVLLWWVTTPAHHSDKIMSKAAEIGGQDAFCRLLRPLQTWGDPASHDVQVANFVLREVTPNAPVELMPMLARQMDAVASQPGCIGAILTAEANQPSNLLGVTCWRDAASFDAYARWAAGHAWRDVINPVTRAVPLRLLTTRANQPSIP